MAKWDIQEFEKGNHLPSIVAYPLSFKYDFQNTTRLLNLPLHMPHCKPCPNLQIPQSVPKELYSLLQLVWEDFNDSSHYMYLTLDSRSVLPNTTQRKAGWHSDSFLANPNNESTLDTIYLLSTALSTEFTPGPFPLSKVNTHDCQTVLHTFEQTVTAYPTLVHVEKHKANDLDIACNSIVTYPPHTLLVMDPYCIHRSALNTTTKAIERLFVKVVFSKHAFNMQGNTINEELYYDPMVWQWVPRHKDTRNHSFV